MANMTAKPEITAPRDLLHRVEIGIHFPFVAFSGPFFSCSKVFPAVLSKYNKDHEVGELVISGIRQTLQTACAQDKDLSETVLYTAGEIAR